MRPCKKLKSDGGNSRLATNHVIDCGPRHFRKLRPPRHFRRAYKAAPLAKKIGTGITTISRTPACNSPTTKSTKNTKNSKIRAKKKKKKIPREERRSEPRGTRGKKKPLIRICPCLLPYFSFVCIFLSLQPLLPLLPPRRTDSILAKPFGEISL